MPPGLYVKEIPPAVQLISSAPSYFQVHQIPINLLLLIISYVRPYDINLEMRLLC
jgi:hypothetical protein